MLLAFATLLDWEVMIYLRQFFSICFGLVLATVGFDIVSGEPQLVFFDITGFTHGIRFLSLQLEFTALAK